MTSTRSLLALAALAAATVPAFAAPAAAVASNMTSAVYDVVNGAPIVDANSSSSLTSSVVSDVLGARATSQLSAATPSIYATATSVVTGSEIADHSDVDATLDYQFQVVGTDLPVPLRVAYAEATSDFASGSVPNYFSVASVFVDSVDSNGVSTEIAFRTASDGESFSGVLTPTLTTGLGHIEIAALVQAVGNGGAYSTTTAYVDPRVTIDPAFLAAHPGVSLVFSAGVGNVGPVPEASDAGMLGLGIGVLAMLRRRRGRAVR